MTEHLDILNVAVSLLVKAVLLTGKQNLAPVPPAPYCFPSPVFK